jgi:Ca-activated chloride channel family protein
MLLALSAIPLTARPCNVESTGSQFVSGVSLVEVYATVTDARGELVSGLTRDDFIVEEDSEPQEVSAFAAGEFPLALAVAIDRSFSVSQARLTGMAAAVRELAGRLRPEDELMLLAIGSENEVLAPLSVDRRAALDALARLEPWGTTPLHDAVLAAIKSIQTARGRRALILLSDGADRYSRATAADVIERARTTDVLVYPVTLARQRPRLFAELATITGGRSFQTVDMRTLSATLATIARELRFQYLLGYTPRRPVADRPGWRSIRVTVNRPNVRVRARDGYVARY